MNRDQVIAHRAWITALVLFAACFIPSGMGWDMMNGGYAWIVLVGFACMAAVITAVMYQSRARQAAALVSGAGEYVVEWDVPSELWQRILQRQYEEEKSAKGMLLRIVWFFCILCGIGFIIYDPEAGVWVAAVMLFVMLATGLAAKLTPGARLRHLSSAEARVRVGRKSLMLGDELHTWSLVGSWLVSADLQEEDGLHMVRVAYAFITRAGPQEQEVLLPVPENGLDKARLAVDLLTGVAGAGRPVSRL